MSGGDSGGAVRRRALLPFAGAAVLTVVAIGAAVAVNAGSGPAAVHKVDLVLDHPLPAAGWTLTGQAQLDSSGGRTTVLEVEVSRDSSSAAVPALTGVLDPGSGASVTCRTAAGATWTVGSGDTQVFPLACDRELSARALERIDAAHLTAR